MNRVWQILPWASVIILQTMIRIWPGHPGRLTWVALCATLALAASCVMLRGRDEVSQLHLASLCFGLLATAGFGFWPGGLGAVLIAHPLPVLYAVFTLVVVLVPLLGGELFTMFFAKKTTPEAVWNTDAFITINRHLTIAWAVLFVLTGLAAFIPALLPAGGSAWTRPLLESLPPLVLLLGIGAPMNKWYPAYYQRKLGLVPVSVQSAAPQPAAQPNQPISPQGPTTSAPAKEREMSDKPKVVAIIGTPHEGLGNTTQMIEMLRPTLEAQGVDLELIQLGQHHIEYCRGCAHCLEKGRCWLPDDHAKIMKKVLAADGLILGSPVYFFHVTAQMKTFIDRTLPYGHKPRPTWKPGLAVSVSAGLGETAVGDYLGLIMRAYGAFSVGALTAIAVQPGGFVGEEHVRARAADLAGDLARAIKEKRRYPATDQDLRFWSFMGGLIKGQKDGVMADDYAHWQKLGLYDGFETYIGQTTTDPGIDPQVRREWIKQMMADYKAGRKSVAPPSPPAESEAKPAASTLRELLEMMPQGLNQEAAQGLEAVYQFEVSGSEEFTAHLVISGGKCTLHDGPADNPGVTIITPADVWLDVSQGKKDGQAAFMAGEYKTQGDISLLMKLGSLFK